MKKTDLKIAQQYTEALMNSGINIQEVYLFGSRVSGKARRWSDLDTCVVSPEFGKDRLAERVTLLKLGRDISPLIEPHPFSLEDFADEENPLAQEIQRTGVRIV